MRIAYDGRVLALARTGDRVYLSNLLAALAKLMPPKDMYVYLDPRMPEPDLDAAFPRRFDKMGKLWKTFSWAKHLRHDEITICHSQYFAPVNAPCKVVTAVHDVSFAAHPEYFSHRDRAIFGLFMGTSLRHADVIIVPSDHTKREIERFYPESAHKVEAMPYAGSDAIHPIPRDEARRCLHSDYGIDFPYIMILGQVHPRKNLPRVLDAYAGIVGDFPEVRLVSVGPDAWRSQEAWRRAEELGIADRVVRPGVVSDEDVSRFLSGAELFCYVSLYEGFGLPVLEAMGCGTPVLASNTTSIPEVAGDAAILVDPTKSDEICDGMRRILGDEELRSRLSEAGKTRMSQFGWLETGRRTLGIYRRMT
jgi:glycosyltransferase involved in cell wall biosynthesis